MFTGIVEALGQVEGMRHEGTNRVFELSCRFASELRPEESLCHDGVCLTVADLNAESDRYSVTAVLETLQRTSLEKWRPGTVVNLERSMPATGRFDGHIVQGHVDAVGILNRKTDLEGSWLLTFSVPAGFSQYLVDKGSICVNGVSLTAFDCVEDSFSVAIIPFTWEHTNLSQLATGSKVNLEFDIIAKYLWKWQSR